MKKDIENKNKLKSKTKSKILVLGLILIAIMIGLFSPMEKAHAEDSGTCKNTTSGYISDLMKESDCTALAANNPPATDWQWTPNTPLLQSNPLSTGTITSAPVATSSMSTTTTSTTPAGKTEFEKQFDTATICYTGIGDGIINVGGCLVKISYYLFYVIPSLLLTLSANFFNAIIAISLSSTLFAKSTFIPTAWAVVRDLSNIFFILILLYIAIQIILDIGGHDAKKMIAKVIIVALLINFSMFFTQVVIDSSNILALIFYNKMDVNTKNAVGSTRVYTQITKENEKDMSGAMVNAFNPISQLNWDNFFKAARTPTATDLGEMGTCKSALATYQKNKSNCEGWPTYGTWTASLGGVNKDGLFAQIPSGIMLGLILVTGAVMLFAAYAFFIAGISFMGRFIELWILIIFSPFAFMSFSIPLLEKVEYIGWDAWLKRLFAVSFMAPIFMFFMYFIFLLLQPPGLFGNLIVGTGMIQTMLLIIIPAMILLILLLQATKFAKKGSGVLGEKLLAGAKMVGGLALGAATGGAALLGAGAIGGLASRAASSKGLNDAAKGKGLGGMAARMALKSADYGSKASFDVRKVAGVGALAKMGGLNLESAKAIGLGSKDGGYMQRRKEQVDKRQKRAKDLEVREDEPLKQKLNNSEIDLQKMLNKVAKDFETIDKELETQRQAKNDAKKDSVEETSAIENIKELIAQKTALRTGTVHTGQMLKTDGSVDRATSADGTSYRVRGGNNNNATIKDLQTKIIPDQKNAITTENRERKVAYAERIVKYGGNGFRTDREAAHEIIMEAKLPDSTAKT